MEQPHIPNLLQLPTQELMEKFGAGRHKPGSGSAAALLGLVGCKMMQTVILATRRIRKYKPRFAQLDLFDSKLIEHESFFRNAVQQDSEQFDRYYQAMLARNACIDNAQKRHFNVRAREELMPATEIPLEIATHAADAAERGIDLYDLGALHVRGDSGVAVSAVLSSCSGALFVVYLNLLQFREGQWATEIRSRANSITERWKTAQSEQFRRVSRIQAEGVPDAQIPLELDFG